MHLRGTSPPHYLLSYRVHSNWRQVIFSWQLNAIHEDGCAVFQFYFNSMFQLNFDFNFFSWLQQCRLIVKLSFHNTLGMILKWIFNKCTVWHEPQCSCKGKVLHHSITVFYAVVITNLLVEILGNFSNLIVVCVVFSDALQSCSDIKTAILLFPGPVVMDHILPEGLPRLSN